MRTFIASGVSVFCFLAHMERVLLEVGEEEHVRPCARQSKILDTDLCYWLLRVVTLFASALRNLL